MDEKNKPLYFLDLLERMKSSLWAARKASGSIEERQKSLTEQDSSKDEAHPDEAPRKGGDD